MLKVGLAKVLLAKAWTGLKSGTPHKRAAKLSLALHLALVLAVLSCGLIRTIRDWLKPKQTLHVFSLEALPSNAQDSSIPAVATPKAHTKPKKPAAIRFQPPPKTPDPKPESSKAKPSKALAKSPQPPAKNTSSKVSYEDFLKQNTKATPQTVGKTSLQTKAKALQALGSSYGPTPSKQGDPLGTYIIQMKLCIDQVWKKPAQLKGGIEAIVAFFVDKDGFISNYTLLKSSHHSLFDQSIAEALGSGLRLPPPPDGKGQTFQLTFKSVD